MRLRWPIAATIFAIGTMRASAQTTPEPTPLQIWTWGQIKDNNFRLNNSQNEYLAVQLKYANLVGAYLTVAAQLNQAVGREVIQ